MPEPHVPVKHKLKDCNMMKNFMTSGSLTRGRELEEDLGRSNTMPFPRKGIVMMVYDGHLLFGGAACLT